MNNLLDNAARFSHTGGEVRCRVADADGIVRIEVEDDGVGIPRKELPHVFDRFYQAGNERDGPPPRHRPRPRRSSPGWCRRCSGRVRADSHEGRPGDPFVVELPALGGATHEPAAAG